MSLIAPAHTDTVESWNATLKRAIAGVWHWLSIKHLDRYCTETAFRWNQRDPRFTAMICARTGRLTWKTLTA